MGLMQTSTVRAASLQPLGVVVPGESANEYLHPDAPLQCSQLMLHEMGPVSLSVSLAPSSLHLPFSLLLGPLPTHTLVSFRYHCHHCCAATPFRSFFYPLVLYIHLRTSSTSAYTHSCLACPGLVDWLALSTNVACIPRSPEIVAPLLLLFVLHNSHPLLHPLLRALVHPLPSNPILLAEHSPRDTAKVDDPVTRNQAK
jgi:hypothetical protein